MEFVFGVLVVYERSATPNHDKVEFGFSAINFPYGEIFRAERGSLFLIYAAYSTANS